MESIVSLPGFAEWMARQRWYPGDSPRPRLIDSYRLATDDDGLEAQVLIVADGTTGAIYQVPLALRARSIPGATVIADLNGRSVSDGTHDSAVVAALFQLCYTGGSSVGDGITVSGVAFSPGDNRVSGTRVLAGEQSNTSIIIDMVDPHGESAPPAIVKVFRMIHHGDNPDVVLQSAIAAAGSDRVPRSIGALVGEWGDSRGHLAFAQEFMPGTRDAWRVALEAATRGDDFTARARDLGAATAEVHSVLASAMPTAPPSVERVDNLAESLRTRALAAAVAVPEIEPLMPAIQAIYDRALGEPWPALQRVHGDYHLGQVLDVPARGWVLLDFEGEPLRPMGERNMPDLALRDVAGMLRSFDYVAGSVALSDPSSAERAQTWAMTARTAFLEGYRASGLDNLDAHPTLLAALELDKALYETLYEVRNRPDWLAIPRSAVERLVQAGSNSLNG